MKSTLLEGGITESEVLEDGTFWTHGNSLCWGLGIWDWKQENPPSFCYTGAPWSSHYYDLEPGSCVYWGPSGNYWYSSGNAYYSNVFFRDAGRYNWRNLNDPNRTGSYYQAARTWVQYTGSYTASCAHVSGTLPPGTVIHCLYDVSNPGSNSAVPTIHPASSVLPLFNPLVPEP